MDSRRPEQGSPQVVVVTADLDLLDHVLAACAAADVEPEVLADAGSLRGAWTTAAIVVVGADQASGVAAHALPRRQQVYLVDADGDSDAFVLSVQLGAAVVTLPSGAESLVDAIAEAVRRRSSLATVLAVLGGSGGVGTSTLAAGLSFVAARLGRRVVLIDADPLGGGVDLLVGAERVAGWRWPRLARARGRLGDLSGQLPQVDGVDLVSMGRGAERSDVPGPPALRAVISSVARSHELVVIDIGRYGPDAAPREALSLVDLAVLLVAADVRGVAAGRETFASFASAGARWGLVVRRPRLGGLAPAEAARGFDLPLLGILPDDSALLVAAEHGEPPARAQRSQLARLCRGLLSSAVWGEEVAA